MGELKYRVVETDNLGGDYPSETFAGPLLSQADAHDVADIFNAASGERSLRFWKVVESSYRLQPGFEP